jgi:hypothetical protein
MKLFRAVAMVAFLAGPAYAQTAPVPKYGETDTPKTPSEIEQEQAAERAYKHSLGNIPDKASTDPWGNVRAVDAPKATGKTSSAKQK